MGVRSINESSERNAGVASGGIDSGHVSGGTDIGDVSGVTDIGHVSGGTDIGDVSGVTDIGHVSGVTDTSRVSGVTDTKLVRDDMVEVSISWEALEDAFENNAPDVSSYLHYDTGEVIRLVEGIADAAMQRRVVSDSKYKQINPVSSREQYRWMEHFVDTVTEAELQHRLVVSIDGKGAFRRFKDVLMDYSVERERWFTFRSERLRACIQSWLSAHNIQPVERPKWHVPTVDEIEVPRARVLESRPMLKVSLHKERGRSALVELVQMIPEDQVESAHEYLTFLCIKAGRAPTARTWDDALDASNDIEFESGSGTNG